MVTGVIECVDVDVSIVIIGYGGLEGGEDGMLVGIVWFVWYIKGQNYIVVMYFVGDCEMVLVLVVRFVFVQLL